MKAVQKAAIGGTVVLLLAVGGEVAWLHHERNAPGPQVATQETPVDPDDLVFLKKERPSSMADVKELDGKTIWVSAGGQMDYYPYAAHRVDFAHKVGVLPSVQRLHVRDIVTQKLPANVPTRIARGTEQAFAVFTLPGDSKEYATAIGTIQETDSTYYCDNVFYYDDPHQMYKFWPPDVWQAVDQHQPKAGMTELEVAMALGVMQRSDSSDYGNRTPKLPSFAAPSSPCNSSSLLCEPLWRRQETVPQQG